MFEDPRYIYLVTELHGSPWIASTTGGQGSNTVSQPDRALNVGWIGRHCRRPCLPELALADCDAPPTADGDDEKSPLDSLPDLGDDTDPESDESLDNLVCWPVTSAPLSLAKLPSMDLFECIEQHKYLTDDKAKFVFRQIAEAVKFLHSRAVVHRDIKDENVVVDENLNVRLIDFGSAAYEPKGDPNHYFDYFHGTIQFASPEILRGEHYHGRPADVWALGILL
ncbi:hypothetical protein HK405_014723, partial [Cladochytrium tenue]